MRVEGSRSVFLPCPEVSSCQAFPSDQAGCSVQSGKAIVSNPAHPTTPLHGNLVLPLRHHPASVDIQLRWPHSPNDTSLVRPWSSLPSWCQKKNSLALSLQFPRIPTSPPFWVKGPCSIYKSHKYTSSPIVFIAAQAKYFLIFRRDWKIEYVCVVVSIDKRESMDSSTRLFFTPFQFAFRSLEFSSPWFGICDRYR